MILIADTIKNKKSFSILVVAGLMLIATLPLTAGMFDDIDYVRLGNRQGTSEPTTWRDTCEVGDRHAYYTTQVTELYSNGQVTITFGGNCYGKGWGRASVLYYDKKWNKVPAEITFNDGKVSVNTDKELIVEIYDMSNIANHKLLHNFTTKPSVTGNFQLSNASPGTRYLVKISDLAGTEVQTEQYYVK